MKKTHRTRGILAIVLALCLSLGMMPGVAQAKPLVISDPVTLANKPEVIPSGTSIECKELLTIVGNVILTVESGAELKADKGIELADGANLTVKGGGTLIAVGAGTTTPSNPLPGIRGEKGTLEIRGGEITVRGQDGPSFMKPGAPAIRVQKLLVKGGTVDADGGKNSKKDIVADEFTIAPGAVVKAKEVAKVTFDTDGGSAIEAQYVPIGKTATKPADPTKAGFTFGGWFQDKACTTVWIMSSSKVSGSMTLYAKWVSASPYPVTFTNLSGLNLAGAPTTAVSGADYTATLAAKNKFLSPPDALTIKVGGAELAKGDFTYSKTGSTGKLTIPAAKVTGPIEITGVWHEVLSVEVASGSPKAGDDVASATLQTTANPAEGVKSAEAEWRKKDGSTFTKFEAGTEYQIRLAKSKITLADGYRFASGIIPFSVKINGEKATETTEGGDTIYTAAYTTPAATEFTVTFDVDGGSPIPAQTVKAGEKAVKPADPTKAGFVFDGWFAEASFTTLFDFDAPVTSNRVAYAKWTALPPDSPAEPVIEIFAVANGKTTKLPKYKGAKVAWDMAANSFAELDAKKTAVKGLAVGETTITMKVESVKGKGLTIDGHALVKDGVYTIKLKVEEKDKLVKKIVLDKAQKKLSLKVSDAPVTLTPTAQPATAEDKDVFYYGSSNPAVVKVTNKGVVTPVAPGKAKIFIYSTSGKSAKVKVTVKP